MPPKHITREFILEGAVRAIHASRVFLIDAIFLYESQRNASAYIFGIIATEQLGRAMWMMIKYNELKSTNDLSTKRRQFAKTLRELKHTQNLRHGVMAYGLTTTIESMELNNIIQTAKPHSAEQQQALARQREIYYQQYNDLIQGYHHTRERTQYMNPDKTFTQWTTPMLVTDEQVKELLRNAGASNRTACMVYFDDASDVGKMVDKLGMRSFLQDYKTTWLTEEWNQLPERHRK